MINEQEILKGHACPPEFQENLKELLRRLNELRDVWGNPMIVTSGFRTPEDHKKIYEKKGIKNIPMQSCHLSCLAADIYDPGGELNIWCKKNTSLLEEIGLWLETRQGSWQHFQIIPFNSYRKGGSIWFNP